MPWTRIIALQGEVYRGVARVEQRQGNVAVRCTLRPEPSGALTAYLVTAGGILPVTLQDGRGNAPPATPAPAGVLVGTSAPLEFLAQGTPRGTWLDLEQVKLRLRLEYMWSGPSGAAAQVHAAAQTAQAKVPQEAQQPMGAGGAAAQAEKERATRAAHDPSAAAGKTECLGAAPTAGEDQIQSFSSRSGTLLDILHSGGGAPAAPRPVPGPVPAWSSPPPGGRERPLAPRHPVPPALEWGQVRQQEAQDDPFPGMFEEGVWHRVVFSGTQEHYLQGQVRHHGRLWEAHALPGQFDAGAAMRRQGFSRFLRAHDGTGYWLKLRPKE